MNSAMEYFSFHNFCMALAPVRRLKRETVGLEAYAAGLEQRWDGCFDCEVFGEHLDLFGLDGNLFDCLPANRQRWDMTALWEAYCGGPMLDREWGMTPPVFTSADWTRGFSAPRATELVRTSVDRLTALARHGVTHLLGHRAPEAPSFTSRVIAVRVETPETRALRSRNGAAVIDLAAYRSRRLARG